MTEFICYCSCDCGVRVLKVGDICLLCQSGDHCPEMDVPLYDPDADVKFRRENPRDE